MCDDGIHGIGLPCSTRRFRPLPTAAGSSLMAAPSWSPAPRRLPGSPTRSGPPRGPIRIAKDTGLNNFPLKGFAQNQIWLALVELATDLLAWTQMLALADTAARVWEPKKLRTRLFATAAHLVRHARQTRLRFDRQHHLESRAHRWPRSPGRLPDTRLSRTAALTMRVERPRTSGDVKPGRTDARRTCHARQA